MSSSTENREDLLSNFTSITGITGERAQFYLEAAGWELETALSSYYEGDLDDQEAEAAAPAGAGTVGAAAAGAEIRPPPPGAPTASVQPPTTRTPGLVTMDSIRSTSAPQSDDQQAFYAGGSETSGQQVLGPRAGGPEKQHLVKDMFKRAKEHGAEEVPSSSGGGPGPQQQRFQGTGYVLGEGGAPSAVVGSQQPPAPKQKQVVLKLWSDGFTLDNGPLRGYHDQGSREFLDAVREGEIPAELLRSNPGTEVDLTMEDHHHEEWKPAKQERVAFQGEGRTLGSPLPSAAGASGSAGEAVAAAEAQARSALNLDESAPTTQLQLRFLDGTRMAVRVNHSHTIGDLYAFVNTARPSLSNLQYELTLFPNTVLEERAKSVGEAKLFNCALVQKLKK